MWRCSALRTARRGVAPDGRRDVARCVRKLCSKAWMLAHSSKNTCLLAHSCRCLTVGCPPPGPRPLLASSFLSSFATSLSNRAERLLALLLCPFSFLLERGERKEDP